MNQLLAKLSLLAFLLFGSLAVSATTYYVKPDGNNSLNGLSAANAWQTLEYAFRVGSPVTSGDVVQLLPGDFTNIMGTINIPPGVSLIGSGVGVTKLSAHSSFHNTTYNGSGENATNFLLRLNSDTYTNQPATIKDFTIIGGVNNATRQIHGGIRVYNRGNLTFENLHIQYTHFCAIWLVSVKESVMRNVSTLDCSWGSTSWASGAIQLANLEDVELDDLDINEARGYGVKAMPLDGTFTNLQIHHSNFTVNPHGSWNNGNTPNITLELISNGIQDSKIFNNYFDNTVSLVYNNGIGPQSQATELEIYDNVFDILSPSRANGFGYAIECSMNDVEIYRNTFNGGYHGIASYFGVKHYNWQVHHNTFYGLSYAYPTAAVYLTGGKDNGPQQGGVVGLTIVNNTVHMTGSATQSLFNAGYSSQTSSVIIKNNLVINNGTPTGEPNRVIRLADQATMVTPDITNNNFYNVPMGISGTFSNNLNVNPQITGSGNKPTPYYTLTSNSQQLIDAGVSVLPNHPYQGTAPDIGAHEYSGSSIAVTGVSLTPSTVSLPVGTTNYQLTKTITPGNASNQNVTWTSSNAAVASVNASGQVTALSVGTATITATSVSNSTVSGTSSITVTASNPGTNVVLNSEFDSGVSNWTLGDWTGPNGGPGGNAFSVVQGANLSGNNAAYVNVANTHADIWRLQLYQQLNNLMLQVGKTYEVTFTAKAEGSRQIVANIRGNTSNTEYWNTNSTPVNLTTAAQTFGPYTFTCNNSNVNNEGSFSIAFFLSGSSGLDVWIDNVSVRDISSLVSVSSVSVAPTTMTLAVGATGTLTKTINPSNATNQTVNWTTSNAAVATVNASGVVTAVAAGNATITVTTVDGNKTATSAVTVVVPVTGVSITPSTGTVGVQQTLQLTKTIAPANATNQNVTWSSSNASVATVDASGLVTGVTAGNATITVTTADGSKTATTAITVVVPVTSVSVTPSTDTVGVQQTLQLTKTIVPANATNQNVNWSSSNASVATVDASGLVTGVTAGNATITVTTADGSKTATAVITVVVPVTSVSVTPSTGTVGVQQTLQLTMTIAPANATNQNVTWSSSNASVATVDNNGLVTGVAAGSATITITTADGNKTATAAITVTSATGTNVVLNAEFDSGTTNWSFGDWTGPTGGPAGNTLTIVTGAGLSGTNAAYVNVATTHADNWRLQLYQQLNNFTLQVGKTYEISFMAKAQANRTMSAVLRGNTTNTDYWTTGATPANLTTTAQSFGPYYYTCSNSGVSGESSFSLGFLLANNINDVWIDKVSVREVIPVTGVTVSPATTTLTLGGTITQQLTATVAPANATNQTVIWTSGNTGVATVTTTGLVTAIAAGTATITATTQNGSFTATSTVTVNSGTTVTTIDNAVVGTGVHQHNYTGTGWSHAATVPAFLNSTLSYSNTTNDAMTITFIGNKIEWYTEKNSTHGIVGVSIDNGAESYVDLYATSPQAQLLVYTSPALAQGTHTFKIRVTGTKNAASSNLYAIHDYVKVYSDNVPVTGVSVSPATATIMVDGNTPLQLTKAVSPANASNQNVTWTSSNTSVATVSSTGTVSAAAAGTATITATTVDGNFTSTCTITVIPKALIVLRFNNNAGSAPVNTGTATSSFAKSTVPVWNATNVPALVGGTSAIDFGTTNGNNYVESTGVINELKSLTSFTLTGWVNCKNNTAGSGGNRIVSWINHGGDGVDLVYLSDGSLQLGVDQWPDGSPAVSSTNKIPTDAGASTGNWRFFAVTYESSTNQVQFYFGTNTADASLDVTRTYNRGTVGTNIHHLAIGHFNSATRSGALDRMFKGLIDDIQIHGGALPLSAIQAVQRGTGGSSGGGGNRFAAMDLAEELESVSAYPNPIKSGDVLYVRVPEGTTNVRIIDQLGKTLQNHDIVDKTVEIATTGFGHGLHFIQFRSKQRVGYVKIIVE